MAALETDLAVVRVKKDGTKYPMSEPSFEIVGGKRRPILNPDGSEHWGWGHRMKVRATPEEVRDWFADGRVTGFGIICGAISGKVEPPPEDPDGEPRVLGLEMVEFEQRDRYNEFK